MKPSQGVGRVREGNISLAVQAMQSGAQDFIEKPVSLAMLSEAIALAAQRLRDSMAVKRSTDHALMKIDRLKPRERVVMLYLADGPTQQGHSASVRAQCADR